MPVFQSIRVQMHDRPGALSALGASLAASAVDIVRLDVVSNEGAMVVDDLYLRADTSADIRRAMGGFLDRFTATAFDGPEGDPALRMGASILALLRASSQEAAWERTAEGALGVVYGSAAYLLRVMPSGDIVPLSGSGLPIIRRDDPFAGRWALQHHSAAAFAGRGDWAPVALREALTAQWIAVAPAGRSEILMVVREPDMPFYAGELERLAAYAGAATATLARYSDASCVPCFGAGRLNLPGDALLVPVPA